MASFGPGEKLILLLVAVYLVFKLTSGIVACSIFLGCLAAIILWQKRVYSIWSAQNAPEVPGAVPFFGHFFKMFSSTGLHNLDMEMHERIGKTYGMYMMGSPELVVGDVDLLKQVLVRDFGNFTNRRTFRDKEDEYKETSLIDQAVSLITDDHWKNVRNTITPAFTAGKMRLMLPLVKDAIDTLKSLAGEVADSNQFFKAKEHFSSFAMDVVCSVAFGSKVDSQRNPNEPVILNAKKMMSFSFKNPALLFALGFPWTVRKIQDWFGRPIFFPDIEYFFRGLLTQVIEDRKKNPRHPPDFLQLLLRAQSEEIGTDDNPDAIGNAQSKGDQAASTQWIKQDKKTKLTEFEVLAQCFIFLLAGFDTTAHTLTFLLYSLALNPEIQEDIYNEIVSVCDEKGDISYETMQHKLPLLEAAMMETLRLYPILPRIDRVAKESYNLNGITIPKGAAVTIPVYAIHHSEEHYPDPEKFIPERFSPSERSTRNPYTYLPFGYGPRNCIGMRFAQMEIKLCLAYLLREFQFEPCDKTEIPIQFHCTNLLRPTNEVYLAVRRRS